MWSNKNKKKKKKYKEQQSNKEKKITGTGKSAEEYRVGVTVNKSNKTPKRNEAIYP